MKNLKFLFLFAFSSSCIFTLAQTTVPKLINYQGIVRNGAGAPLPNKTIGLKFQIHESGPSGGVVFSEPQSVTTNSLGLFSTQIGKINNLGIVSWLNTPYFLDLLVDTAGGSSYVFTGSQQLVSVPFALYADKAGNAITYSPSPNILISGPPSHIIDLSPTLTNSLNVGAAGIIKSTIPKLDIDVNGRITAASEYTANIIGDISGPLFNQKVTGLQGIALSSATPSVGQVLQYQSSGWVPVTMSTSTGPWTYTPGNIFPSNNPLMDKVNIGQTSGSSLLNVLNNAGSSIGSAPVVNFSNSNSGFNAQGVLSVTNFSGTGAGIYVQNNVGGNNSQGMIINMSNTLSSSTGLNLTHVGTGMGGSFITTNPSNPYDALVAQSNSGGASAINAKNLGSGSAITGSNNATAATAQFFNGGNGNVIYSSSSASNPNIIAYNAGGGVAIHGFNTSTVTSGGAHGIIGQTGNPSNVTTGVFGINTNVGAGVYGLNNFTANASSFAHGVRGETTNGAAQAAGVWGQNFGGGSGVYGVSTFTPSSGNAFGVYGEANNSSVSSSGVLGKHFGAGNGVTGITGSTASNAAGVFGENVGIGYSVYGVKQGSANGNVARFENLSNSNNADAVHAITQGAGAAVHAQAGSGGGSSLALLLDAGHIKAIGPPISVSNTSVTGGFTAISAQTCIACNDIRGTVSFVTSATGFSATNFADVTINFAKSYATAPIVNITPINDMQNISFILSNVTTSSFTIRLYRTSNVAGGSLTTTIPSSTFKFNYFVIE